VRIRTIVLHGLALAAAAAPAGCMQRTGRPARKKSSFPVVVIETSQGTIEAELWPDKAPITVENFLGYVDDGHYDQTIFHRCIGGFMIQGGGFGPNMQRKQTRQPIRNEADNGARNLRGTLAMARTSVVHSATDQFFINTVDNRGLDHGVRDFGYAVFGKVIDGMDVVDRIERAPVVGDPRDGRPQKPVVIKSIRRAGTR
jgi:peptidyl-prolyl cis-trans isomerase A (cyclophilin A)